MEHSPRLPQPLFAALTFIKEVVYFNVVVYSLEIQRMDSRKCSVLVTVNLKTNIFFICEKKRKRDIYKHDSYKSAGDVA